MITSDFDAYLARLNDDLEGPFTMSKRAIVNGIIGGLILWAIGFTLAAIVWGRG